MIVNLKLTRKDFDSLCMMMGYAAGAHMKGDAPMPTCWKELTDWILIQGSPDAYTYWTDKNRLKDQKEKELIDSGEF